MSDESSVKLYINCSICDKRGHIYINKNMINKSDRGVLLINIDPKIFCDHSIAAYIDNNFAVRDCFTYDFELELPQIQIEDKNQSEKVVDFSLNIIKLNIIPSLMANILRTTVLGKKLVVINESDELNEHFTNFFTYIFEDTFKFEIVFIQKSEHKKHKKEYKDYIVLQGRDIIYDKNKIIKLDKLKIEYAIIHHFFAQLDPKLSLLILKDEIYKLFKLSEDLIKLNDDIKENQDFTSKLAIDYIHNKYEKKIPFNYLTLLIEIIENYFKIDLKKPPDSADFLGFI